jgi:DNA repair protein RadC
VIKKQLRQRGITLLWKPAHPPTRPGTRYRLKLATWIVIREPGTPSPRVLSSPQDVALFAQDLIRDADDDKEHFWVILLNAQNRYLMHTVVSVGTQSASLVHPREVLGPALREGATSVLIVHNHPSGDPTPSREDLRLTRQLSQAAKLLDINLHDHLIIGNGTERWVSLAERGAI